MRRAIIFTACFFVFYLPLSGAGTAADAAAGGAAASGSAGGGRAAGGRGVAAIADDSRLRRQIAPLWFTESPASVLANQSFIAVLDSGGRVEVKTARSPGGDVTVSLAREENGKFTGWSAGSWAYTRNSAGEPVRLRFFPRSDPYTYIQFRPFNHTKSHADFIVYDAYISRSWPVSGNFESILTKPVPDIFASLSGAPLRYFEPEPEDYRDLRELARNIRRRLGALRYEDDGAINADGEYVFIKTEEPMGEAAGLNCSGFSKWLVDGIVRPRTGTRLAIAGLKQPAGERGSSYTAAYEAVKDPFFGLDWIRNLAANAARAFKGEAFAAPAEYEVRAAPFSMMISRGRGRNGGGNGGTGGGGNGGAAAAVAGAVAGSPRFYPGFLKEAGFGIEGLGALLYTLAIDEPGFMYLGAVNNDLGPRPRMRQYFHIAAFIPYFDDAGVFHIALFESASENSFNRFKIRYPEHYINLVRIPVEGAFDP